MGCQPLLRIWCASFCFSFTDCLSRHIFPHVPLGLLSISLRFFFFHFPLWALFQMFQQCVDWFPLILKHSSHSKKQLWLTSPRTAQFCLWLFTFPYIPFPFHFIDWKFDSIFFCSGLASFIPTILCCCLYPLLFFCLSSFLLTK